jgi:hypothetical protein
MAFQDRYFSTHLSANTAGTAVTAGPGVLHSVVVNTAGATDTTTLYDGTSTAGTVLAVLSEVAGSYIYDIAFETGLFVAIAGTTAPDLTITYLKG